MGYKETLGIDNDYIFNKEVDAYFKNLEFYEDTMNPRFMGEYGYDNLTLDAPVLRFDSHDNEGYTTRIFLNKKEAYTEKQSPWRSYDSSNHIAFPSPPKTIQEIEDVLDELVEIYKKDF